MVNLNRSLGPDMLLWHPAAKLTRTAGLSCPKLLGHTQVQHIAFFLISWSWTIEREKHFACPTTRCAASKGHTAKDESQLNNFRYSTSADPLSLPFCFPGDVGIWFLASWAQGTRVNVSGTVLSKRELHSETQQVKISNRRSDEVDEILGYILRWLSVLKASCFTRDSLGLICVPFSNMGLRRRTADPAFSTHKAFYQNVAPDQDIVLIENVCEYDIEIVKDAMEPVFTLTVLKVDPRVLGLGASRARVYIIAVRRSKLRWIQGFDLYKFIDVLTARVKLSAGDYWWRKLPPQTLSPSDETWLFKKDWWVFGFSPHDPWRFNCPN